MTTTANANATATRSALRVAIALVTTVVVLALTLAAASAISEPEIDATISIPTSSDCASQSTGPFKLGISSDGAHLYATLNGDGRVGQIDTATGTVTASACTGARYPEDVAVSPDGARIYVTNSAASTMSVLATADMSTVTDVSVGYAGNGVDVVTTPASVGKVYVYRHLEGSLVVVNAADNAITTTVNVGNSSTRRASGLALTADGSTLYALIDAGVAKIDTATDSVTEVISMVGAQAIAASPDDSFLYVVGGASNDSLTRIRTSDNTVVATVSIGSDPTSVEITPDGDHALVVLMTSRSAVFVDTATNAITSTVTVGATPYGSVIAPSGTSAYVADWGGGFGDTLTQLALGWEPPTTSVPPTSESTTTTTPTSTSTTEAPVTTTTAVALPTLTSNQIAELPAAVLTSTPPKRGEKIRIRAGGFSPRERVQIMVASDPVVLGEFDADSNGEIDAEVDIPTDLQPGAHHLAAYGLTSGYGVSQAFTIESSDGSALPATGTESRAPLVAGLGLVVAGAGLAFAARTTNRRRRNAASW